MISIYWLIAFVVFVGIEVATMALTTIWFAGGALLAFILAMCGASVQVQWVVFVLSSFLLLFFTRPVTTKFFNRNTVKTNAEGLIGKKARVTVEINDDLSTGAAIVNGQEWTARAQEEKKIFPVGAMVEIKEIKGVKLIVTTAQEE